MKHWKHQSFLQRRKYLATIQSGASTVGCECTDVANLIHLSILQFKFKTFKMTTTGSLVVMHQQRWDTPLSIFTLAYSLSLGQHFSSLRERNCRSWITRHASLTISFSATWEIKADCRTALLMWGAAVKAILKATWFPHPCRLISIERNQTCFLWKLGHRSAFLLFQI